MINPLISVIVPVFDVKEYLDTCVSSIMNQTYEHLEVILVDDGSTDSSDVLCDDWAKNNTKIIVVHKVNGGLSDARNVGMNLASGECIGFVDSDDTIAPEMYERLYNVLIKDNSDISCCAVEMVWPNSTKPNKLLTVKLNAVLNHNEAQEEIMRERLLKQPVWYKLYKKELINGIWFEVGKCHEDVFWSYQAINKEGTVSLIDYVGYFYCQREDSIMGNPYSLKRLDGLEAKSKRQRFFEQQYPHLCSMGRLDLWSSCIFHGQMALRFLGEKERKYAFIKMKKYLLDNPISRDDYATLKFTSRMWLDIAQVSLRMVCRIKNLVNVGF